ncbi:MAG: sugar ABC transporter ATP-binding protein, partial [Chloroflexota bacterium]
VMIIDKGRKLFDGALAELKERFSGSRQLIVDLAEPYDNPAVAGAQIAAREGLRVTYRFDRRAISASELIGRLSAAYRISDLSVQEPDIESTIRRIYEEKLLEI